MLSNVLLLFTKVWAILFPFPAAAPLIFVFELTVQLKAVPLTTEFKAMAVIVFEQMVEALGVATTTGLGFTVTLKVSTEPGQLAVPPVAAEAI